MTCDCRVTSERSSYASSFFRPTTLSSAPAAPAPERLAVWMLTRYNARAGRQSPAGSTTSTSVICENGICLTTLPESHGERRQHVLVFSYSSTSRVNALRRRSVMGLMVAKCVFLPFGK